MKDHDPRITVTEHSLHHGVRPKSRETVRVMKLKPPSPWRHPRSMPDSPDPATALAPAPTAAGSPFGPSDSPTRFREEPFFFRNRKDDDHDCCYAIEYRLPGYTRAGLIGAGLAVG